LGDSTITVLTVLANGRVAGYVLVYVNEEFGKPEVVYWYGREYWGRGVATRALKAFLGQIRERPLYGRAAQDNVGSRRVLEKCGFSIIGTDRGFANARNAEIEEIILELGPIDRGEDP
jgi:RimJ/RimL family protein N-acetyltransferase